MAPAIRLTELIIVTLPEVNYILTDIKYIKKYFLNTSYP